MCILIHHPKDSCFRSEQLQDFYSKNPDGFGAIVKVGDEVKVYKMVGSFKEVEDLYFDHVACYEAVIHFRMKTHGDIDLENCHPYEVTPGLFMAHNGILSTGNSADPKMSDTWHYINDYLRPLISAYPDILDKPQFRELIGDHIGNNNRFAFMNHEGEIHIINKNSGVTHDGIWYSNTYAWTPWKFGYGQPPAPIYPRTPSTYDHTKYATSSTWREWDAIDRAAAPAQKALPFAKPEAKPAVKGKRGRKSQKKQRAIPRLGTDQLARIIRSSYNAVMLEDYNGAMRWVTEHPMKAMHFIYELLGSESNPQYTSQVICDKVNNDPEWAAETVVDLWVDMEVTLLEIAGIESNYYGEVKHV
jgi:hypothetical protein